MTKKQNPAAWHHYVPRVLLRGFAMESDAITAIRLPGDHSFQTTTKRVGAAKHLYTVDVEGEAPDAFERLLSDVEADAGRILRQIVSGGVPLSEEDRNGLAYFVALQAVRGPELRRSMEHIENEVLRIQVGARGKTALRRAVEQQTVGDVSDEQVDQLWDRAMEPGAVHVPTSQLAFVKQIVSLANELMPYITGRPWTVYRFEKRSLIIGDSPVGLIEGADHDEPFRGVGFMTAWGITFPITRKVGILMAAPMVIADLIPVEVVRSGRFDRELVGTTAFERLFNETTVRCAREWIFHHPQDARFVPHPLPAPDLLGVQMVGDRLEFDGAAWSSKIDAKPPLGEDPRGPSA